MIFFDGLIVSELNVILLEAISLDKTEISDAFVAEKFTLCKLFAGSPIFLRILFLIYVRQKNHGVWKSI